jgi:uncharacterized protein (DUF1778 family)
MAEDKDRGQRTRRIVARVTPDQMAMLRRAARELGMTMSDVLRALIPLLRNEERREHERSDGR